MKTLPLTTTLNIDGEIYQVDKMSPAIQELIERLDDWKNDDAKLVNEITKIRSAIQHIQAAIYNEIIKERAEAAEKAEKLKIVPVEDAANSDIE